MINGAREKWLRSRVWTDLLPITDFAAGQMFRWAVIFLVLALIAGGLGLFHVQFLASHIAWALFALFLVLFLLSFLLGRIPPD